MRGCGLGIRLGFGGGGFSPKQLSGLEVWFDPTLENVTLVSGRVSLLKDKSGVGDANRDAAQGSAAQRPLYTEADASYNNRPTLTFTTARTDRLVSGIWSVAPSSTGSLFAVGNFGTAPAQVEVMVSFESGLSGSNKGELYKNAANDLRYFQGSDLQFSGEQTIASPHVYAVDANGASTALYQDAVTALNTGNAGSAALNCIILGTNGNDSGGVALDGRIAEVIRYNRVLSSTERGQVLAYLGLKYGIPIAA